MNNGVRLCGRGHEMSITEDFEKRKDHLVGGPRNYTDKAVEELLDHTRALEAMLKNWSKSPLIMALPLETRFRLGRLLDGVE